MSATRNGPVPNVADNPPNPQRGAGSAAQLALALRLRDDATLDNFLVRPALAHIVPVLEQQPGEEGEPAVYLCGLPGSGRSHLLQAACHAMPAGRVLYLPLALLTETAAEEVLADAERMDLVCLDDLDAVVGNAPWELALFHLCNRARESGTRLLFSAGAPPRELPVGLPDLQSRLSWAVVMQLPEPGDEDKLAILRFRAARRGLQLPPEVATYILSRAPRSLTDLMDVLECLDKESLVHKRQLSVPFVKQCMGW